MCYSNELCVIRRRKPSLKIWRLRYCARCLRFHYVPCADHIGLLREIRRVLSKKAGRLFIYEHNPLNPLTLRAVRTCEFDRDAVLHPIVKDAHAASECRIC
jgi:hypothetical protein